MPGPWLSDWFAVGGGVPEAPIDGLTYGRKDAGWTAVSNVGLFSEDGQKNIIGGAGAGDSITSGTNNFCAGENAGTLIDAGSRNIVIGVEAGGGTTGIVAGDDNIVIGDNAGKLINQNDRNVIIGTGAAPLLAQSDNIAIGYHAMRDAGSADSNTCVGSFAGRAINVGDNSVAIGFEALGGLNAAISSNDNVAIGARALGGIDFSSGGQNVAIGSNSLNDLTTGASNNTACGNDSGSAITTGSANVFLGNAAGDGFNHDNTLFIHNSQNVAPLIGGDFSTGIVRLSGAIRFTERADHIETPAANFGEIWLKNETPNELYFTDDAGTDWLLNSAGGSGPWTLDADENLFAGTGAGASLEAVNANDNFLAGNNAGTVITTGDRNIAIGLDSLLLLVTGVRNIAIGGEAGDSITGSSNTFVGDNAGREATSGGSNTALGAGALGGATAGLTGAGNVALGAGAIGGVALSTAATNVGIGVTLSALTSGANNMAIGEQALNRVISGGSNVAVGTFAGNAITTASFCVAIGPEALGNNSSSLPVTTGQRNIAIGRRAMFSSSMSTAQDNIGMGFQSLLLLTTGDDNVAIGQNSGRGITSGSDNISIGIGAMGNASGVMTTNDNIAIGRDAMSAVLTTALENVCIGANSGQSITSGVRNVLIGIQAGDSLISTSNNVVIGYTTGEGVLGNSNVIIGALAVNETTFTGANNVIIGQSAGNQLTGFSDFNVIIGNNAGPNGSGTTQNQLFIHNAQNSDPLIGGNFATGNVTFQGTLRLTERADHILTPTATFGEVWIKNDTPNKLLFTDDAGTDWVLNQDAWVLIETVTVSGNPTNIDLTWDETLYSSIRVELNAIQPSTDAVTLIARLGDNDGATIHATSGDYDGVQQVWEGTGAFAAISVSDRVDIAASASNVANETISGYIEIFGGLSADTGAAFKSLIHYLNSVSNQRTIETKAFLDDQTQAAIDTLRLFWGASSTWANTGDIKVYGLKRT